MSSPTHPLKHRSDRLQNRNSGPPNDARPPPPVTGPSPQPDNRPATQPPTNMATTSPIRPNPIGPLSSPRTQGSFNAPPQPPTNRPSFTPASLPGSITGQTQNITFHDTRANYSHSAAPFSPSRFQTIDSEVTSLKNTVNQMQQSITAVKNRMQQLPDVLEQLFQDTPTTDQ